MRRVIRTPGPTGFSGCLRRPLPDYGFPGIPPIDLSACRVPRAPVAPVSRRVLPLARRLTGGDLARSLAEDDEIERVFGSLVRR